MKKLVSILLAGLMVLSAIPAMAAGGDPKYTIPLEGVVLQNSPDRNITPADGALDINPVIEGESPTTGQPYDTTLRYMPMLVQISNPVRKNYKYNGKRYAAAGVGVNAPWGAKYADIVYEGLLYREGQTRLTFVFSDSFAEDEPVSAGPVRSARMGHVMLREEWQGAIVFAGGPRKEGNNVVEAMEERGVYERGLAIDLVYINDYNDYQCYTSKLGRKGPGGSDNLNIWLKQVRDDIPAENVAEPHPFLFVDESPYTDGYEIAYSINLDWGHENYVSHYYYDENENLYLRYSCEVPYMTYPNVEAVANGITEDMEQVSFSNVIIQRVPYEFLDWQQPLMQSVGKGNADIFIGGRYIPGYWVRESESAPTVFLDDKGNEILLTRGRTYIAHLPEERVLTYQGAQ